MNQTNIKALKRYLHPGHTFLIIAVALIIFAIVSISTIFLPLLSLAVAALLFWLWSSSNKEFKKEWTAAEKAGELDSIAEDFAASQSVFRNQIRMGNTFLFGKKCGHIVRYTDICRYYVSPNRNFLYPSCELSNSRKVSLCQLRSNNSLEMFTQLLQIGNTIRSHNPNATVE